MTGPVNASRELLGVSDDAPFRFVYAEMSPTGEIVLEYEIGNDRFLERVAIPVAVPLDSAKLKQIAGLVRILHWVAGVSYYKTVLPDTIEFVGPQPTESQTELIRALYTEGLGEFAVSNQLDALPNPRFQISKQGDSSAPMGSSSDLRQDRSLVSIGGGKDSIVALRGALEHGGVDLFSVGDAEPIRRCSEVSGLPRMTAHRSLDQKLFDWNNRGALNGHVPVTAIVSLIACITAEASGIGNVVMANERSASVGNLEKFGITINHQFSKSLECERLLRAALSDSGSSVQYFSILRGASELLISRAFSQMTEYHQVFTSCNSVFRINPSKRNSTWCGNCPKCRFVFLALAPFLSPRALNEIFGTNLLDQAGQLHGYLQLAGVVGSKPFECVGEISEVIAAFHLLSQDANWRDSEIIRKLTDDVLVGRPDLDRAVDSAFSWSDEHMIPTHFESGIRKVLDA